MDNNILIDNIKNGDDKSFEILLDQHRKMIYKIIYTLQIDKGDFRLDTDSLFQEGSLALYKAVFTYRNDNNMCFTSYAYMVIRSRIMTYVRDNYNYLNHEHFSIDNCDNIDYQISMNNLIVNEDPVKYHREKEFEQYLDTFISKLSNEDKEIFKLRSEEYSYKQIAKLLNIKTKRIDNRLRVLRNKLKKYLAMNKD